MTELLHAFGVEWNVLLVQVVNVGILVFLLHRFAFKPLLSAIDARREKIEEDERKGHELEERLLNIENREAEVIHAARMKSELIIQESISNGKKIAEKIAQDAKNDALNIVAAGKKVLADEKTKLVREVKTEIGGLIAEAVKKTAGEAYGKTVEEKMINDAILYVQSHNKTT